MTQDVWAEDQFIYQHKVPSRANEHYLSYSSYDKDGTISSLEFKETALVAYEQAILLAPYEAILHYHRGQLLEQLGRITEASQSYEEALRLGYKKQPGRWAMKHQLLTAR